jgi:shikimate kinase
MKVFLAGVGCVGKTAIGERLAARLGCPFYDLDREVERHFGQPIERLKSQVLAEHSYRKRFASVVLKRLVQTGQDSAFVVALPPSGLMDSLYAVVKNIDCVVVALRDSAENILSRITFYDADSRPITKTLTAEERSYYLKEIRRDMAYFGRTFRRADMMVDIGGLDIEASATKIEHLLRSSQQTAEGIGPAHS